MMFQSACFYIAGKFTLVRKNPTCFELFIKYYYATGWFIDLSDYVA